MEVTSNIVLLRIQPTVEEFLSQSQNGYCQGRNTSDIAWCHRYLAARVQKFQEKIMITGIDITSASGAWAGIFQGRGGFCKLGNKLQKCFFLSNTNNLSKYTKPGMQFHDKENPHRSLNSLLIKVKDIMYFTFLYHIMSLYIPEPRKQ